MPKAADMEIIRTLIPLLPFMKNPGNIKTARQAAIMGSHATGRKYSASIIAAVKENAAVASLRISFRVVCKTKDIVNRDLIQR